MNNPSYWEPQRRSRRRALQALYQWHISQQDMAGIIRQFYETQDFDNVDKELFENLANGVSSESAALQEWVQPSMDRPFEQCDVMERVILLIGAWHLVNRLDIPYQVTLDECIDLARRFGSNQSPAYVNGVLDKASRALKESQG